MRVFTASLATETNTFSPIPTDHDSFLSAFYAQPGEHPETPTICSAVFPVLRRRQAEEGFTLIEGTAAWAEPGGYVRQDVYEGLRDEILGQLQAALPVDCVILGLHGAMVARETDDCEGDLLARVRELVGPSVVVAAELDPHSHLTAKRVDTADLLVAFQEFPHIDFEARAEQVVELALAATRGQIQPVMSTYDCRMIDVFPTTQEPMRSFVDGMKALEGKAGILSVSLIHGFMAGDVPEMGTQMLVITDNAPAKGAQLAQELGEKIFALRGTTKMRTYTLEEALAQVAQAVSGAGPIVLADMWDNPGGGTSGDNTLILRALIKAGVTSLGVSTIWDPQAAQLAHGAGVGTQLELRIGGKTHPSSGPPFDGLFEVQTLADPGWQSFVESRVTLGKTAVVRLVGTEVDIILNSNRTQTFDPNIFTNLSLDPSQKRVLLVKSTNHFYAAFAPLAQRILHVAVPTGYPSDPATAPYRNLTRALWPRVAQPFKEA
jgi:microcystin degradation protein MlrC